MHQQYQKEAEEKQKAYYSQEQYRRGSEDIIDVDYQEFEDDKQMSSFFVNKFQKNCFQLKSFVNIILKFLKLFFNDSFLLYLWYKL